MDLQWTGFNWGWNGLSPQELEENVGVNPTVNLDTFLDDFWTGLKNVWYNWTGQPEKTSSYQAMLEHEENAPEKFIESLVNAGLSKYSYTGGQVGTPNAVSDPLAKASQFQSLISQKLSNDERRHNLSVSEDLGIRTNDQNYAAKWAELGNVLFGFDPTKVEGGIIPFIFSKVKNLFSGSGSDPGSGSGSGSDSGSGSGNGVFDNPVFSNVLDSASADQASDILSNISSLRSMDDEERDRLIHEIIYEDIEKGNGIGAGYRNLPEAVTKQIDKGLIEDITGLLNQKGFNNDDHTINRIAEFLSKKYNEDINYVKDLIYDRLK